ncbi:MAG: LacI family DNA-binding transcriptional regulator [Actinomycetaceae bacterium]|nr:LacI family DNA-binding transcriptional regulator [Actinomycetaceae bacterium]
MVSRADVAKAAGVSPSTVSYVLNGKRPTTPQTQKRVRDAIHRLGYVPNQRAGNLAARSLRTLAIHLGVERHGVDVNSSHYIDGMQRAAREAGISLIIPVLGDAGPEELRSFLRSQIIDAMIFMEAVEGDRREQILIEEEFPGIVLGYTGMENGLPFVESDFLEIGKLAFETATRAGHSRLLVVLRNDERGDWARTSHTMLEGFVRRAEAGDAEYEVLGLPSHPAQADAVLERIVASDGPTIVISDNDVVMTTLVGLAWGSGLELGKDYSVVMLAGEARYSLDPSLAFTEISTDRLAMGRACVQAALQMFEKRDRAAVASQVFPARLIERGTVADLTR